MKEGAINSYARTTVVSSNYLGKLGPIATLLIAMACSPPDLSNGPKLSYAAVDILIFTHWKTFKSLFPNVLLSCKILAIGFLESHFLRVLKKNYFPKILISLLHHQALGGETENETHLTLWVVVFFFFLHCE